MTEKAGRGSGLLGSLRQFASTTIEIVHTRIELLATELDEERQRVAAALWLAAVGAFCLALGILLGILFLVVLFWDTHRLLVLGMLSGGFLAAGIAAILALRTSIAEHPRLFSQTLAELRRDHDQLNP